jgi:CheY-like chemotaxis protein
VRHFKYRVLFVDDEKSVRETAAAILVSVGYEVLTAVDGLDALEHLDGPLPELVVTDLRMPRMSGFELLAIVRQRFPQIPTIAISGEYVTEAIPDGLLADAFLLKGQYAVPEFLVRVEELLAKPPVRPFPGTRNVAPIWVPLRGSGEVIATCPKCLRSSDLDAASLRAGANRAACTFCRNQFTCNVDQHSLDALARSRATYSPARKARSTA